MEEMVITRDGKSIRGKLLMPSEKKRSPLVIISHGLGSDMRSNLGIASLLAGNGIAAFIYDFMGGGSGSLSDGKMTEMSVLTEASDLEAVLEYMRRFPYVDTYNIFLMGKSQGGYVSSYVAARHRDEIRAMVLYYPAFVIYDDSVKRHPDPKRMPAIFEVMGNTLGSIYERDAQSVDIYGTMRDYPGNVLIIHGVCDDIVPVRYSERAVREYPSARLISIDGAGHGFTGSDETFADEEALLFIKENIV